MSKNKNLADTEVNFFAFMLGATLGAVAAALTITAAFSLAVPSRRPVPQVGTIGHITSPRSVLRGCFGTVSRFADTTQVFIKPLLCPYIFDGDASDHPVLLTQDEIESLE